MPYNQRPNSDHYPDLAHVLDRSPGSPVGNVLRRNAVVAGSTLLACDGAEADLDVERWFTDADASLADRRAAAQARNAKAFALRPDAPALRERFTALPLCRMDCTSRRWASVREDLRAHKPC